MKLLRQAVQQYCEDDPLYILYPEEIVSCATDFVSGFPGQSLYAIKANPHPAVLQSLWQGGIRNFDVASLREMKLVNSLFPEARLFLMHPVKSRKTIRDAYALGVRDFAFDCDAELTKILTETGQADDLHLHLRLNVDASHTGGISSVMPLDKKFGALWQDAISLLHRLEELPGKCGVTFHVGSQCLDPLRYEDVLVWVSQLLAQANCRIDSLDVGGGFPVAYPGMRIPPLSHYFDRISKTLCRLGFDKLEIFGEPGRALVATGGATLARVELRKGRSLYLNEGTYGSLFDAGQCKWRYPVHLHTEQHRIPSGAMTAFRFYGPTCDSLDEMAGPFLLPECTGEGDWIEIGNLGAYGQAMATRFNGFYGVQTVTISGRPTQSKPLAQPSRNDLSHQTINGDEKEFVR